MSHFNQTTGILQSTERKYKKCAEEHVPTKGGQPSMQNGVMSHAQCCHPNTNLYFFKWDVGPILLEVIVYVMVNKKVPMNMCRIPLRFRDIVFLTWNPKSISYNGK